MVFNQDIYINAIKQLDPNGNIVRIDQEKKKFIYHKDIKIDRNIRYTNEEFCRAYIVAWLCTKGGYSPHNIYLEKGYTIGRKEGKSIAWGDILIRQREDNEYIPYMVIEVKAPSDYDENDDDTIEGQLFKIAHQEPGATVLSLATVIEKQNKCSIKCITIDYARYPTFDAWKKANRPVTTEIPKHFGKPVPEPLIKGGKRDLRKVESLDELDKIWSRLHNLLWGGYLEDNDVFEYVVRLLLTKIYDERVTPDGKEYAFQIKYKEGLPEKPGETFGRINNRYKEAVLRYLSGTKPEEIEDIPKSEGRFGIYRVRSVVSLLQEISLTETEQAIDILGRFFNRVVREGFKQSKALYLTHPNIVYFILYAIDLPGLVTKKLQSNTPLEQRLPYIIDPACGSGTFLLAAFRMINDHIKFNRKKIAITKDIDDIIRGLFSSGMTWAHTHLYGLDPHKSLPIAAKVNMILHGDASGHIFQKSALLPFERYRDLDDLRRLEPIPDNKKSDSNYEYPCSESFDVVVSNPPFSIDLSKEEKDLLKTTFAYSSKEKSENLFFERWYQLLKPGGRLGVVLPESFFSTSENFYIRQLCYKYFNIKAIVYLPEESFEPYTTTLTGLLFAQKKFPEEVKKWDKTWKEEEDNVKNKINEIRRKIHKSNWAKENISKWIEDRIDECKEFLEDYEVYELKESNDIEEVVKKLRKILDGLKGNKLDKVILRRVCKRLNYSFPISTVENIGYRRTKRSTRTQNNELFDARKITNNEKIKNIEDIDTDFYVNINANKPQTALDIIRRDVKWD